VGDNLYGYVVDCINNGTVTSTWDKIGGIVGQNQVAQTEDEPVDGKSSVIERCINNGSVSGRNSSGGDYVGGIVGMSSWSYDKSYTGAIRNCLNTGTINGSVAGGIIGNLETSTKVENCLNIGLISGTSIGGIAGAHIESCSIQNSYYKETDGLSVVGRLGSIDGECIPSVNEQISDTDAKATIEQIVSGEISWKLNTKNGTVENSEVWAKGADAPTYASDTVKATYKVTFDFPEGIEDIITYTDADGKVEIPAEAEGKALTYKNGEERNIFTADIVVTTDTIVTVAEKQPCAAPVFENNIDTLTSAEDKEASFTLNSQPESGIIFKVYSAETEGELVGTASWSGTTLIVTLDTAPTSNTTYYVSMTTPLTTESVRSPIVVNAYVKPSHSSGGHTSSNNYAVDVPSQPENGSLVVSPKNASKGSTVTITVTPDSGYQLDTITATDAAGNSLKLTKTGDGKYTFTMPSSKVNVKASFAQTPENSPFTDVAANAYYYEAVKWAVGKNITGGVGNGLFAPDQPCTRAQMVTFLWRASGSPEPSSSADKFTDVPENAYYAKAVAWAVEKGITLGTSDTTFAPDLICNRAQSVTFLYRALGTKTAQNADFRDVPANSYYAEAVAWASANHVTTGIGNGLFDPDADCTRAQIVTFLYRAMEK
jgi:hypothetical protein